MYSDNLETSKNNRETGNRRTFVTKKLPQELELLDEKRQHLDSIRQDARQVEAKLLSCAAATEKGDFLPADKLFTLEEKKQLIYKAAGSLPIEGIDFSQIQYVGPCYPDLVERVLKMSAHLSLEGRIRVSLAYLFANFWHAIQSHRTTGEPYIFHPVAVAAVLGEYHVDASTLVAALLHDVHEDHEQGVPLKSIEEFFGKTARKLVDGLTKIGRASAVHRKRIDDCAKLDKLEQLHQVLASALNDGIVPQSQTDTGSKRLTALRAREKDEAKAAKIQDKASTFRKLLLTMTEDLRTILVKLADRIHNLRTLSGMRPDKQVRIAKETLDWLCPIATRLGIWRMKTEMEDACFYFTDRETSQAITAEVANIRRNRAAAISETVDVLNRALVEGGFKAKVVVRPKHAYSIYQKLVRTKRSLDELYDLDAINIVLSTEKDCYAALGVVHRSYRPWLDKSRDYMANPKSNNYRALHTTITGSRDQPVEVQICSEEQAKVNEYGVLAKFYFSDPQELERKLEMKTGSVFVELQEWIRSMVEWQKESDSESGGSGNKDKDLLDVWRGDLLSNEVFAFTPDGKPIDLPSHSNPIDFAFRVHTDLGYRCVGAYVNGLNVSLTNYEIKDGDIVQIQYSDFARPQREWYDHCNTLLARNHISKFLAKESREANVEAGRRMVNIELLRNNAQSLQTDDEFLLSVAIAVGFKSVEELFFSVGCRRTKLELLSKIIVSKLPDELSLAETGGARGAGSRNLSELIEVVGSQAKNIRRCACCSPVPGDEIVGFSTGHNCVKVHTSGCVTMQKLSQEFPQKVLALRWAIHGDITPFLMKAGFAMKAVVRKRLTADVLALFDDADVNIFCYSFGNDVIGEVAQIKIIFQADSAELVASLQKQVAQIPGIVAVERLAKL